MEIFYCIMHNLSIRPHIPRAGVAVTDELFQKFYKPEMFESFCRSQKLVYFSSTLEPNIQSEKQKWAAAGEGPKVQTLCKPLCNRCALAANHQSQNNTYYTVSYFLKALSKFVSRFPTAHYFRILVIYCFLRAFHAATQCMSMLQGTTLNTNKMRCLRVF